MGKRGDLAEKYFREGYNCAQSVVLAFKDLLGQDDKTLIMLSSPFGAGMGRMREVCGAVTGMFIVLGFLQGYEEPGEGDHKRLLYEKVQELARSFSDEKGSILCRDLLGDKGNDNSPTPEVRDEEYYRKRPCLKLVIAGADILAEYLKVND